MLRQLQSATRIVARKTNSPLAFSTRRFFCSKSEEVPVEENNKKTVDSDENLKRIQELTAELEAARTEVAEQKKKFLQSLADAENLRNRHAREKDADSKYAISKFAGSMVDVADTLRMAIVHIPDVDAGELKSFIDGVKMTENMLMEKLGKFGVKRIDPVGEPFDPAFHEALFQVPDATKTPNTVAQVVQSGYVIHDRVLRAAKVGTYRS